MKAPLSKPLAGAYLAVAGLVWLGTLAAAMLAIITGRTSWTTHNPWVAVPGFIVIISAISVVRLVDQRLTRDAPRAMQGVRWLGLIYGSALREALRSLRHTSGGTSPSR